MSYRFGDGPETQNPRTYVPFRNLWYKLEGIAYEELSDVLHDWADWTPTQAARLRVALQRELAEGGHLYAYRGDSTLGPMGKATEPVSDLRVAAKRLIKALDKGQYQRRPGDDGGCGT